MNIFPDYTRRHFIKKSSAALIAGALSSNFVLGKPSAKGAKNAAGGPVEKFDVNGDTLKVGLIGCGGRGTGAASNALNADDNVVVTAMADAFTDQLDNSFKSLKTEFGDRIKVDPEHKFVGFDAYQKVIDSGVDVVILTSPPGFRPAHLKYAVEKGKHIFTEKPMATDAPGVRSVIETVAEAKRKKLSLVAGFCWRYDNAKRATFQQVLDGAIGDIRAIYTTYNTGSVGKENAPWTRANTKSQMEWMMRRWYFFTWLSGDHLVEQAVHSIDKMSWAMGDKPPLSAIAHGGRQVRTDPECGHIFDHFSIVYDYPNGAKGFHFSRQQDRCAGGTIEDIWGTKGICSIRGAHKITGEKNWKFEGEGNNMYQTEHDLFFESIRDGKPMNDGDRMALSTMVAIMGRMAAYTGQQISYDEALNSKEILVPEKLSWDLEMPMPQVAMPGRTQFI
jgi:myo-inositol 2-dehydrogenase/D-chiro-inositol 1-dehydrogenase